MKPRVSYPAYMAKMLSDREMKAVLARGDTFEPSEELLSKTLTYRTLEKVLGKLAAEMGKSHGELARRVTALERQR